METIDSIWILICMLLVLLMQIGFACIESGMCRMKNNISVIAKNITDTSIAFMCFWLVGFTLMFGYSWEGFAGFGLQFPNYFNIPETRFYLFQAMLCGTTVTIISGIVAERLKFKAFIVLAAFTSIIVYPIYGHWVWNIHSGDSSGGWLRQLGFIDFAGGSVVFMLGGAAGLALSIVLKPRQHKFDKTKKMTILPSNMPLAGMGALFLWLGWYGFHGGAFLTWDHRVPSVFLCTTLGAISGALTALCIELIKSDKTVCLNRLIMGLLAGLASVASGCHLYEPSMACIVAGIGAGVAMIVDRILSKYEIDDAVYGIPVYLGAGAWGVLAISLFASPDHFIIAQNRVQQFLIQLTGIIACLFWSYLTMYGFVKLLNRFYSIRVSEKDEMQGLNISEHGIYHAFTEMSEVMRLQAQNRDLSMRVPEEPFTDTWQIAKQYNNLISNLENNLNQTETIFQITSEGILAFYEPVAAIHKYNAQTAKIFGYSNDELSQKSFFELVTLHDKKINKQVLNELVVSGRNELIGIRKNGECFPLEMNISYSKRDDGILHVAVIQDITDRKKEQELLSQALRRSEFANQAKDEFLTMVNHELRTPLNSIIGNTEVLKKSVGSHDQEKLDYILNDSEHLLILINDILDQASLADKNFKIEIGEFNVYELLQKLKSSMEVLIKEKDLKFYLNIDDEVPKLLLGDETRIYQVLSNICVNAIKFTDEGVVTVRIKCFEVKDGIAQIHFSIKDTGIGIEKKYQDAIFDTFSQIQNDHNIRNSGIGLGMTISQNLVHKMKGKLDFESEVGKGAHFWFTLPLEIVDVPNVKPKPSIKTMTSHLTGNILLVEDTKTNRVVFKQLLAGYDLSIDEACNGIEALQLVRENLYDAIFMDLRMPQMDGFEATKEIRSAISNFIPIIGVTANTHVDTECIEAGMDGVLEKPLRSKELENILNVWINDYKLILDKVKLEVGNTLNQSEIKPNQLKTALVTFFSECDLRIVELNESLTLADGKKYKDILHALISSASEFHMNEFVQRTQYFVDIFDEKNLKFQIQGYVNSYYIWKRAWLGEIDTLVLYQKENALI